MKSVAKDTSRRIVLLSRWISRHIHFSKRYVGRIISMEDDKGFQVIRDLKVDLMKSPEKSVTFFKVRFKFSSLFLVVKKRLSFLLAPFLMAKPGFREKIWTLSEDGYFQGINSGLQRIMLNYTPNYLFLR